jgi:hypothetical protein
MFDPYQKLPVFLRKLFFTERYVKERIAVNSTEADRMANESLVEMLFKWHHEQFVRHEHFESQASLRDLNPAEMEQDNLAVSVMQFLEDAAAYVSSLERGSMPVSTLRNYLEAKLILSVDILEGSEPYFALDHIVSRLRRIEEANAPFI